jgi:DNA polymerase-4
MRSTASILHLDLDAFFAAVEQRDKPSLRGKPVLVGGVGGRGVVSTASYEARAFGVGSAMSMAEARRKAPGAAVLSGRFPAYRQSSRIVMALLHELSPAVEAMSVDEAYVDLAAGGVDTDPDALAKLVTELRAELYRRTEGLTASVGVASSKMLAKLASEAAKPNGQVIVIPGTELDLISPLPIRKVQGIGPATAERLNRLGVHTVFDLQEISEKELIHELGASAGAALHRMAFAQDDRPVAQERVAKSISVEDTFEHDLTDPAELSAIIDSDAAQVAKRLVKAGFFARTISIKVRFGDFTTYARSRTLDGATDRPERIAAVAHQLLSGFRVSQGIRLLGVGVANFVEAAQEELFVSEDETAQVSEEIINSGYQSPALRRHVGWRPGEDVEHANLGRGWVWGSRKGLVTVRFESRMTSVGPVRTFAADDPALSHADPLPMTYEVAPNQTPEDDDLWSDSEDPD